MLEVKACALSDVGRSRRRNEDFFAIDEEKGIYLVADGMGGHGHGEVASRLAVAAIGDFLRQSTGRRRWGLGRGSREEGREARLRDAIDVANRKVLRAVERDRSLLGMGTTLVAMLLDGERATIAHVGDSRAYRWRENRLTQLTDDHTWVNEQVSAGNISETQARSHPFKSVVTRALGGAREVEVEVCEVEVAAGDRYLLCSDGLTGMITDERIAEYLRSRSALDEICRALVDEANRAGGRDNITVLILAVAES